MLRTAAKIDDKDESITIFFLLVVMGRVGLRVGEVLHLTESWWKPDRKVISVPPFVDCNCGRCKFYAKRNEPNSEKTFGELLEEYWKPKEGAHGSANARTRRTVQIINRYFNDVPYTDISYSTIYRRLVRIAELTEGVDPEQMRPHVLRATAATHWMWAGMRPPAVDGQFRWTDPKTKDRYVKITGLKTAREMDRVLGRLESDPFKLRDDPPTWEELRPENEADLIHVETWETGQKERKHPRYRDDEDWIREQTEQETISDYFNDDAPVGSILAAPTLYAYTKIRARAALELAAMRESDDMIDPTTPRGAAQYLSGVVFLTAVGLGMLAIGYPLVGVYATLIIAGVYNVATTDIDIADPGSGAYPVW